jgi:hypothetical protein
MSFACSDARGGLAAHRSLARPGWAGARGHSAKHVSLARVSRNRGNYSAQCPQGEGGRMITSGSKRVNPPKSARKDAARKSFSPGDTIRRARAAGGSLEARSYPVCTPILAAFWPHRRL